MSRSKKITLKDGRSMKVLDTGSSIIIRYGCRCGHGLLIYNGSYTGICSWYDESYELLHEFVDEIRDLLRNKNPITVETGSNVS